MTLALQFIRACAPGFTCRLLDEANDITLTRRSLPDLKAAAVWIARELTQPGRTLADGEQQLRRIDTLFEQAVAAWREEIGRPATLSMLCLICAAEPCECPRASDFPVDPEIRCPDCGEVVDDIFAHVDRDSECREIETGPDDDRIPY